MFKVGDIVRAKPEATYMITCESKGFRGKVTDVYTIGSIEEIVVKTIRHNDFWPIGSSYPVYAKDFILDVEHFLIKFVEETLNLERK